MNVLSLPFLYSSASLPFFKQLFLFYFGTFYCRLLFCFVASRIRLHAFFYCYLVNEYVFLAGLYFAVFLSVTGLLLLNTFYGFYFILFYFLLAVYFLTAKPFSSYGFLFLRTFFLVKDFAFYSHALFYYGFLSRLRKFLVGFCPRGQHGNMPDTQSVTRICALRKYTIELIHR